MRRLFAIYAALVVVASALWAERWWVTLTAGKAPHLDEYVALLGFLFAVVGVVLFLRTIARQNQAMSQALEMERESDRRELAESVARRANLAKTEFLSRMSHELRTPLNSILGFAQLTEMERLSVDVRNNIRHITSAGRHLLTLIDEVLDIARIEEGRMSLSLEPVRVGELVHECVAMTLPLSRQREVRIEVLGRDDIYVKADQQRLKQVILNLISNGIKYNRPKGSLTIDWAVDGSVEISVADTGLGLTLEQQKKLFTPFARLGAETSAIEGSGLGLVLSRGLVDAMGGTMSFTSEHRVGSTFRVKLQRAEAPKIIDLRAAKDERQLDGAARGVVLYIEDNLSNIRLVERIVAKRPDVELLTAMQGEIGLDVAKGVRPDVIFLDLNLPDMNGSEVLARLSMDEATASIPVIIVSADATKPQRQRLLDAGATDFVTKPFDVVDFLKTLDAALERGGIVAE